MSCNRKSQKKNPIVAEKSKEKINVEKENFKMEKFKNVQSKVKTNRV